MIYSLDTSALIFMKSEYSYDVFGSSLWDVYFKNLVDERRLIASVEVKEELKDKDAELSGWLKDNCRKMFIDSNEIIQNRQKEIINRYPGFVNLETNKNYADPFIIALALEAGKVLKGFDANTKAVVVTYEGASGNLKGPKMPDICKEYGLKVWKLINIFREEKWSF